MSTPTTSRTVSRTATVSETESHSTSPSATASWTVTATPTSTSTWSSTFSSSASGSASATVSATSTASLTAAPSLTLSATSTDTPSTTLTATASAVASFSATNTATSTATVSVTATQTATRTASLTMSRTASLTMSRTVSASLSPTLTESLKPFEAHRSPGSGDSDSFPAYAIILIVIGLLCVIGIIIFVIRAKLKEDALGNRERLGQSSVLVDVSARDLGVEVMDDEARRSLHADQKKNDGKRERGIRVVRVKDGMAGATHGVTTSHNILAVDGKTMNSRKDFESSTHGREVFWLLLWNRDAGKTGTAAGATAEEDSSVRSFREAAQGRSRVGRGAGAGSRQLLRRKGKVEKEEPLVESDYVSMCRVVEEAISQKLTTQFDQQMRDFTVVSKVQHAEETGRGDIEGGEQAVRGGFENMSPTRGGAGLQELDRFVSFTQAQDSGTGGGGGDSLVYGNPLVEYQPGGSALMAPDLLQEYTRPATAAGGVGSIGAAFIDNLTYCPSRGVCVIPFLKVTDGMPPATRQLVVTPGVLRVERNDSEYVEMSVQVEDIADVLHTDDGLVGLVLSQAAHEHDLCMQLTPAYSRTLLVALGNVYLGKTGHTISTQRLTSANLIAKPLGSLMRLEGLDV